jgi:zinc transport system substrate-binding protein
MKSILKTLVFLLALTITNNLPASTPHIVVSIPPIYSLTMGVMKGLGKPYLLMNNRTTPHDFYLKPSHIEQLRSADLLIWVGPTMESHITKAIQNNVPEQKRLTLVDQKNIMKLPNRHNSRIADAHIWLNPKVAKQIVDSIASQLIEILPNEKEKIEKNVRMEKEKLDKLDAELSQKLADVQDIPFMVFHDGFQYFTRKYNLDEVGTVVAEHDHDHLLGLKSVQNITKQIEKAHVKCLFAEYPFPSNLIRKLAVVTNTPIVVLDPLGLNLIHLGEDAYFETMRTMAEAIVRGLKQ